MSVPNTVDPKQFTRVEQRVMFNAYGDNLLEIKDLGQLDSVFTRGVMGMMDVESLTLGQRSGEAKLEYQNSLNQSHGIPRDLEDRRDVLEVFQGTLGNMAKQIAENPNKPPASDWIQSSAKFWDAVQQNTKGDFNTAFKGYIDHEKQNIFNECLDQFGPKAFEQLKGKLDQIEQRKGAVNGLIDELHETFATNLPAIQRQWPGLKNLDDAFGVGMKQPLPPGFDPKDILQLGKVMLAGLKDPANSSIDIFDIKSAAKFRDEYKTDLQQAAPGMQLAAQPQMAHMPPPAPAPRMAPAPGGMA